MFVVTVIKKIIRGLSQTNVWLLSLISISLITLGTVGGYLAENPGNPDFQTIGDCFFWALVTMSTVGYGDQVPLTVAGRIVAVICMIGGPIALVGLVGATGVQLYNKWTKGVRGMSKIKSEGHIVICTWNEKAKDIIDELRLSSRFRERPITIIDDKIEAKPVDDHDVSFVRGNSSEINVLRQANIEKATYAIVLAADSSSAADQKTVLTILAIETTNPAIVSCAELNDANNEAHLHRAGCNIVVNTPDLTGKLLAMSLQNGSIGTIIMDLISGEGNEIYMVKSPERYVEQSYINLLTELKTAHNLVLIGVERGGECLLNPPSDLHLQPDDFLLVIAEEQPSL